MLNFSNAKADFIAAGFAWPTRFEAPKPAPEKLSRYDSIRLRLMAQKELESDPRANWHN